MNTTIVEHKVTIARSGDHVIAKPNVLDVKKGDTLQIGCSVGTFRVKFDPWPFAEKEEADGVASKNKVLTFERLGDFLFFCYLTPPGATRALTYLTSPEGHPDGGRGNVHP
jgi:hypothetical protein